MEAKKKKNTKNETIYRYRSRSRNPYRFIINYFYINHNIEGKNNCYFIKLKSNNKSNEISVKCKWLTWHTIPRKFKPNWEIMSNEVDCYRN